MSSIVNPEKLGHLGPVADLGAILRREAVPEVRMREHSGDDPRP